MRMTKLLLLLGMPMLLGIAQALGQQKAYVCIALESHEYTGNPNAHFLNYYYSRVFLAGAKPEKYGKEFAHFVTEHYGVSIVPIGAPVYIPVNPSCTAFGSTSEAQSFLTTEVKDARSPRRHIDVAQVEVETGWSYSGNEESAETTSGEGPSEAEALHIARSTAVRKKDTPVSHWDEPTCSQGTKPKNAYDQTPVPNWICTQPYKSIVPSPSLAGSELGEGLTKAAALANAHSLATHKEKGTIQRWGTPVYSKVLREKNQFDTSLRPIYLCTIGYLYASQ